MTGERESPQYYPSAPQKQIWKAPNTLCLESLIPCYHGEILRLTRDHPTSTNILIQQALAKIRADSSLSMLLKQSGILYMAGLFSLALSFAQQISTARILGADDYGRLAVVISSGMLVMLLVDFRTWEVATKFMARPIADQQHPETVRVMSWLLLIEAVTGMLGALGTAALAGVIAVHLLQAPDLDELVRVYALSIPFRVLSAGVIGILPRLYNRFDWVALKSVIYAVIRLVLMTGAALLGFGLTGVVVAAALSEIINMGILLLMTVAIRRRHLKNTRIWDFQPPQQFLSLRRLLGDMWIVSTLAGFHFQTFIPLMALLTIPAQVGLFRTGMDIAELIEKTVQPMTIVFSPQIIALHEQERRAEFRRYLKQVAVLMLGLTLLLGVGLLLAAHFVLPIILPDADYARLPDIVMILVIGLGIHTALQWWIRPAMVAFGRVGWLNLNMAGLIVLSFPALVLLVPVWGAAGGAVVKAAFMGLYALVSLVLLRFTLASGR